MALEGTCVGMFTVEMILSCMAFGVSGGVGARGGCGPVGDGDVC